MPSAMVIGLVCHSGHRPRFEQAARTLTGVSFAWATYDREEQIRERITGLLRDQSLDGLLLGLVPYARSRDLLPPDLPVTVTRSAALDLALVWSRARGNGWPATPVSIDTFTRETVDEVATALDLDPAAIACLPFDPDQPIADVVAFHREQIAATGASYVISVRTGVAAALDGQVAVLNALATPGTIRADLHELALRVRNKKADGQRFAAGVFLVAASSDLDRARVGLQHLLLNTPEFADAWIDNRGRRGVVVFAHAALFETVTHQWVGLPVLAEARTLGIRAVAGFGIGASARLCVTLAERAAARAEQDADPGAYLISDNGMVIGPMGASGVPLTYTYQEHGGIEALAGRVGLSPATLSRLAAIERHLEGRPVSPSELARSLGITDPSGRRLIRKLSSSRLAIDDGSSQVHRKGRPTRMYRLAITTALEPS
ncbi:MarR family transcriptional regulator [Actinoplanes sp. TFC3]|uniref:MarR family transcriptional regulator n=1 Tax=Actinoplanes sp. TFC3 TaxID=1710355 RepID=UPI000AF3A9BD|nr:MarR family transcriptional regulator [Actinoplanes sp. TFC3]